MKKFSTKIQKERKFDDIFKQYQSYNKSKKEGKNFTYNFDVRNAVAITISDKDYFVITGKYHSKNLSFIFGTDEYYENNSYNGRVLYDGIPTSVENFVEKFHYIDTEIMCCILNLYYDKFKGFNDKAFWHA
jgi:hypothetical protein